MRSSIILILLGAVLAIATPVDHDKLHKKAIVWDIVTDIVYVTVTETPGAHPPPATVHVQKTVVVNPIEASSTSSVIKPHHSKKPTSTSVPPPPPPPTTSSTPPPAPITPSEAPTPTIEPAPIEATTQAPVEVPSTTPPVVEAPAATPAPVIEVPPTTSAKAVAPPPSPVAPVPDNSLSSTGVDNHNSCRSKHSGKDVAWNETLASYAAKTAATCVFAHDMSEGGGGYGQNIASQGSSSSDAWTLESALENAIIQEWYSEVSMFTNLYGQESPSGGGDWLHFTQIVWKSSLEIGCAVQACPTSNAIFPGMYTWFTVCNYYPQGNVMGEFTQNVVPS